MFQSKRLFNLKLILLLLSLSLYKKWINFLNFTFLVWPWEEELTGSQRLLNSFMNWEIPNPKSFSFFIPLILSKIMQIRPQWQLVKNAETPFLSTKIGRLQKFSNSELATQNILFFPTCSTRLAQEGVQNGSSDLSHAQLSCYLV